VKQNSLHNFKVLKAQWLYMSQLSAQSVTLCFVFKCLHASHILPAVLYGCETWSLTLREEYRLRVFENRVLRIIFGPNRDEVTVEWSKLHSEELHNLYSSPDIIRQIKSKQPNEVGRACGTRGRG
jgi:hypothetical protein